MPILAVRHCERPELWERVPKLFAGVWPEYNLHGDVMERYWHRLHRDFSAYQLVLYDDETDDLLAEGRGIPCAWDGTLEDLGPGIDAAIVRGFDGLDRGVQPNTLCALGIEIPPHHQGRSLAKIVLRAMTNLARNAGFRAVIVPLRPTWKERYPLTPIERYVTWTGADGSAFDPWIRVHQQLGASIAAPLPCSSQITGTVGEWEAWTQMRFPDDGAYVFPGGLATLDVDRGRDLGSYWEPNVWMIHALA